MIFYNFIYCISLSVIFFKKGELMDFLEIASG